MKVASSLLALFAVSAGSVVAEEHTGSTFQYEVRLLPFSGPPIRLAVCLFASSFALT
jgi:hypothetical protein